MELVAGLGVSEAARYGVVLGELGEVGVGVAVAVYVLQHEVLAVALVLADVLDDAVIDSDHGRVLARKDVDRAPAGAFADDLGRVVRLVRVAVEAARLASADVALVARGRVDGEVSLRQTGQRPDQVGRHAGDQSSTHQNRVDVPGGVVVRKDRLAQVGVAACRFEVTRRREDCVNRVVRVFDAVLVCVDSVRLPRRGHELHPAECTRGRNVEVAPVVGLDLVDRGEHFPANAVLTSGRLINRKQERRNSETVDDEVRNAFGCRTESEWIRAGGGLVLLRLVLLGLVFLLLGLALLLGLVLGLAFVEELAGRVLRLLLGLRLVLRAVVGRGRLLLGRGLRLSRRRAGRSGGGRSGGGRRGRRGRRLRGGHATVVGQRREDAGNESRRQQPGCQYTKKELPSHSVKSLPPALRCFL